MNMNHCHTETETFTMQEKPISNSLSKTDSNEGSNPPRNFMPLRYGSLRYAIVDVEIGLTDHRIHDIGHFAMTGPSSIKPRKKSYNPSSSVWSISADTTSSTTMPNTSSRINKFPGGWSTRFTSRPCSFPNVPIIGSSRMISWSAIR